MPASGEPDAYQTYLLRLWRARCQGEWQWRASLESRHTGERQVFASLEQLFAFLGVRCESLAAGTAEAPASESTSCQRLTRSEKPQGGGDAELAKLIDDVPVTMFGSPGVPRNL